MPPSTSIAQQHFMGAELARLRAGKKTKTGMTEDQLRDFARKPLAKKKHRLPRRNKDGYY